MGVGRKPEALAAPGSLPIIFWYLDLLGRQARAAGARAGGGGRGGTPDGDKDHQQQGRDNAGAKAQGLKASWRTKRKETTNGVGRNTRSPWGRAHVAGYLVDGKTLGIGIGLPHQTPCP